MSTLRAQSLMHELQNNGERLDGINKMYNDVFQTTATSQEEIDFLMALPHTDLFRRYKIKHVHTFAELLEEVGAALPFAQLMENYFYLAAEYALLGIPEKMDLFVKKINWQKWSIADVKDPTILQAYRELVTRSQELRAQQANRKH